METGMARRRHYPGTTPMCAQHIRTEWARLRDEQIRCPPGADVYWALERAMVALSEAHKAVDGRVLNQPGFADRCGPGPAGAKTGLGD
jgi:hypothetical protein